MKITSLQHANVKHWVKLRTDKAYRYSQKRVVIDGLKMVHEVCPHQQVICLITSNETLLPVDAEKYNVVMVSEEVMEKISGTKSPEGLMAEIEMPAMVDLADKNRLIVLDGISDPGNLGTILRTALALGWEGAYLLGACCDPYNDKALRAAKGATFRLPIFTGGWNDLKNMFQDESWQFLGADLHGLSPESVVPSSKRLLVLGNETHGLSKEAQNCCTAVSISMSGQMESLNVSIAAGILMYVLKMGQNDERS